MNENEKAAIAAGLWTPTHHRLFIPPNETEPRESMGRDTPAPDMHDPANLWRALENIKQTIQIHIFAGLCRVSIGPANGRKTYTAALVKDAVFAALVALYDAEHLNDDMY